MDLTRRQEITLRKLLDIYREVKEPLHYSVLADRLGVSRFTAYDMLRLLEEKGFVTSEYRLDKNKSGPGRSEIVFMPTEKAHRGFAQLVSESDINSNDWESIKENVLKQFKAGVLPEGDLFQDLLDRIPSEDHEVLGYCVEVMTAITLRLQRGAGRRLLLDCIPIIMPAIDSTSQENLALLSGFALGILALENIKDREWCLEMFKHLNRYQTLVSELDAEQQQVLGRTLMDIYDAFQKESP